MRHRAKASRHARCCFSTSRYINLRCNEFGGSCAVKNLAIDLHAHALIGPAEDLARRQDRWRREAQEAARLAGRESSEHNQRLMQTAYLAGLTRIEARLATMDAMGIDVQAVSPVPMQYHYWAEREAAEKIVASVNEGIAAICHSRPERFVGLGS